MNRKDFMRGLLSVPVVAYAASAVNAGNGNHAEIDRHYPLADFKSMSPKEQDACLRQGVSRGRWYAGSVKYGTGKFYDSGAVEESDFPRYIDAPTYPTWELNQPGLYCCRVYKDSGKVWAWISYKSDISPLRLWKFAEDVWGQK